MKRTCTLLAAAGIAVGGFVHFLLWHGVYHHAPIHEMFIVNVVVSAFLAIAVFIPKPVYAAAGAALSAGSLTALVLSRTVGLPTFHGRWSEIGLAPAGQTVLRINDTLLVIVAESVALVACAALIVLAVRAHRSMGVDGRRRGAKIPPWAVPLPA